MEKREKKILGGLGILSLIATCACSSYAGKNSDSYWSSFDSREGARASLTSGFVVVDASGAGGTGIGPFRSGGPSFTEEDVILEEENGEEPASSESPAGDVYWHEVTVKAGDTLSKIAENNGVSIKDIATANELTDQHKLREGQTLFVPNDTNRVLETLSHVRKLKEEDIARRKQAAALKVTNYVVKEGDSLWSIANAFDLDVNTLFGSNKISETNILKVGTAIRVPNQDGIFVKAAANQTVAKLAKEYSIFPEAILSANEMTPDSVLAKGAEIFLPGAKVTADPAKLKAGTKNSPTAPRTYGWPVVGKISSSYGWRRDPVRGGRDFHTGLDIRAPYGRSVVAAASGTVVYAGWMGGYGKTVVISHPGNSTTLYGHNSKLLVSKGQKVQRGARIAQVGSTGRSTGNHVHFEVRKAGKLVNPLQVLR